MIIRKKFQIVGSAHIVLNCSSDRCRKSYHAHSPVVELFISADKLDNAGMILDFGLLSNHKRFLNVFKNTLMLWKSDNDGVSMLSGYANDSGVEINDIRWVILPFNPTAENLSLYFHMVMEDIIKQTKFKNNESNDIRILKVRYHETKSGYAESNSKNMIEFRKEFNGDDVQVSNAIINDDKEIMKIVDVMKDKPQTFENPDVELKIK